MPGRGTRYDDVRGWSLLLDRHGRSIAAWREQLARLAQHGELASYREPGARSHELAVVVLEQSAPAERRIGAALAMIDGHVRDAAREIHAAALTCRDARLRRALESLARGEIDEDAIDTASRR